MLTFALSEHDSWQFARLSGDFNPLHVDPIVARRLQFGGTICHGVHLALKALDLAMAAGHLAPAQIASIGVVFGGSVRTGSAVSVELSREQGSNRMRMVATNSGRAAFTAKMDLIDSSATEPLPVGPKPVHAEPFPPIAAQSPDFPSAPAANSPVLTLPLQVNDELLKELLPALAVMPQGLHLAADLMATTRIVGMECPGLHSIYSELKLQRLAPDALKLQCAMEYSIQRADPRFRSVRVGVSGGTLHGTLGAFFRAPPVAQAPLSELQKIVHPMRFSGQTALVVGGSRGLGELVAKLLVAGGATVTLSYARGKTDAELIQQEAVSAGRHIDILPIDASQPLPATTAELLKTLEPTHVYYFATPPISKNTGPGWRADLFTDFCMMYVHGFAAVVQAVAHAHTSDQAMHVLYPSTIFLDQVDNGFAEYRAAKAAGESLCEDLAHQHKIVVHKPRLPRLQTDQNSSFLGVEGVNPIPLMLELLEALQPAATSRLGSGGQVG